MTITLVLICASFLLGMMILGKGHSTVIWDLETTGLSKSKDRIVEFGAVRINADGSHEEFNYLINPEMPIPEDATNIHGITDLDVFDAPTFADLGQQLHSILQADYLVTFNGLKFDVPLFAAELTRVGIDPLSFLQREHLDVIHLVYRAYPRNLEYIFGDLNDGATFEAHNAIADCKATAKIIPQLISKAGMEFSKMSELAEELRSDSSVGKSRFAWGQDHRIYPTFGKYSLTGTNPRPLCWIMENDDFVWSRNIVQGPIGGQYTGWKGHLEQHIINLIINCESSDFIQTVAAKFPPHRSVCKEHIELVELQQEGFEHSVNVNQCTVCGTQYQHRQKTSKEFEGHHDSLEAVSEQMNRDAYWHEAHDAIIGHKRNVDEARGDF